MDCIPQSLQDASAVSVCFLVDTTGSMGHLIGAVRENVKKIVGILSSMGAVVKGLAFVGYKDWCDGPNHFDFLEFTPDVQAFANFVSTSVRASGGGDEPEDVLGGIGKVFQLKWPEGEGTRILFHIADAPPHGNQFHAKSMRDDHPAGHPKDPPLDALFETMRASRIIYTFGRLNNQCDTMIRVFSDVLGGSPVPVTELGSLDGKKFAEVVSSHLYTLICNGAGVGHQAPADAAEEMGVVVEVDPMTRLRRFLVLGAESGAFVTSELKLGLENAMSLKGLLECGRGKECVDLITTISTHGLAAKQNVLSFAMALCGRYGDLATRKAVCDVLVRVCSIPTSFFQFVTFYRQLSQPGKGFGRWLRGCVAAWYNQQEAPRLAMSVTKYKQREGWRHADILRLAHVKPAGEDHTTILQFLGNRKGFLSGEAAAAEQPAQEPEQDGDGLASTGGRKRKLTAEPEAAGGVAEGPTATQVAQEGAEEGAKEAAQAGQAAQAGPKRPRRGPCIDDIGEFLRVTIRAKACTSAPETCALIAQHGLVREHCNTALLNSPDVWKALLEGMPLTAMLRNLNKMTAIGLLAADQDAETLVVRRLHDEGALRGARIHPFNVLMAQRTYGSGAGKKGELTWTPIPSIQQALAECFYLSFHHIEPSGKRILVALDVSPSMQTSMRGSCLTSMEAAGAVVMALVRSEERCDVMAFGSEFVTVPVTRESTLDDLIAAVTAVPDGYTDCTLPVTWAYKQKRMYDAFVVFTDSEPCCFRSPSKALRQYRKALEVPDARLIVASTSAGKFSIADPNDPGMLDVVGLDSSALAVMSNFIAAKF